MHPFSPAALGALLGLAMHHIFFRHGEWHKLAPDILLAHLVSFIALEILVNGGRWIILAYLAALFSSITIYRLFFHRLNSFPGPVWARMSKIGHVWKVRKSQNHLFLKEMREKYGDFVRTGPSELTVYHPDVFVAIDGPSAKCGKAEWYDLLHPNKSLATVRSKEDHAKRRRQWNKGFTPAGNSALKQYNERVFPLLDQLDTCIQSDIAAGRVSEASDIFYWFGFDRMGDLIFGQTFNMLSQQRWHDIIFLLKKSGAILGPLSPVPWLMQIATKLLPRIFILGDGYKMRAWCESQMLTRMRTPIDASKPADISHYLIEDGPRDLASQPWMAGDCLLAIVAGSDPTAALLIIVFTELADHPADAEKIRREIENVDIMDPGELARRCPHLEAVILESLRLFPALPTGGYRKTLKEGVSIGGTFIPPDTTIVAPRFPIARREDCFERANEFIPERWYKNLGLVHNKTAFAPFGTGSHTCLGKPLAMNDMRLVTARLLRNYRFRYPKGETGEALRNNCKDQFTSKPGRLRLIFEAREDTTIPPIV
ncbi:benzoate 4-monooxygenase cytochrome P450 [Penicillium verhagenii]|uniref:benzoate 4-monooxygenase cytochrome P450 n=1 Tax=Penicillium verhagenii TaxID=1562060 RepID=UPI002544D753|nr:benzoate 4-monooxygenase cytochrome P450 [Penicillium verhagenii]KAJ5936752.1 benzoate 4-monooxygenase cytochrome P450 [Penicillium verhagenii]